MYDRAFIQQKYMLNYSVRAENFSRWKPYVPDEEAPKDPSKLPSVIHWKKWQRISGCITWV